MRFRSTIALALSAVIAGCNLPTAADTDPNSAKSPAPKGYVLPSTETLGLIDLANFAKLERDFVKPDDFAKGFDDSPLNGRTFVIRMPLAKYAGSTLEPASWSYNADTEEFTLSAVAADIGDYSPSLTIQNTTEDGPNETMSNAFGAEIEVTTMETWTIELGRNDETPIGVFEEATEAYSITPFEPLTHSIELKPEQARALVADLEVWLEGVVAEDAQGQTVNCYDDHTSATLSSPTEWNRHTCSVQVRLSRVAFIRKDGTVIKEWR